MFQKIQKYFNLLAIRKFNLNNHCAATFTAIIFKQEGGGEILCRIQDQQPNKSEFEKYSVLLFMYKEREVPEKNFERLYLKSCWIFI